MTLRRPDRSAIVGAAALAAFGAYGIWQGSQYHVGQLTRMGPGMFPVGLGLLLLVLALVVLFDKPGEEASARRSSPRAVGCIFGSIVAFGLVVERFGVVPATVVLVVVASLAERRLRPLTTAAIALGLSAVAVLLFIEGLGLPMQAFDW